MMNQFQVRNMDFNMKCWHCNSELIWNNDFSYKDYGLENDGIVSVLTCSNEDCNAYVEVYLDLGESVC